MQTMKMVSRSERLTPTLSLSGILHTSSVAVHSLRPMKYGAEVTLTLWYVNACTRMVASLTVNLASTVVDKVTRAAAAAGGQAAQAQCVARQRR